MTEPLVRVGILTAPTITVKFHGTYIDSADGTAVTGPMTIDSLEGLAERTFVPVDPAASTFELYGVLIGVEFHWQRRETQRFSGALRLLPGITAINVIPVEEYLKSVISSEMNSGASAELLKAHAVISRSWLMAMLTRRDAPEPDTPDDRFDSDDESVQWWDRDDHTLFDVCADDHCQRYQGVTRMSARAVGAVEATRGQVLTDADGGICDARFSKCCGGVFELFENCWAPVSHPYLRAGADTPDPDVFPDLTIERNAEEWILGSPAAFCNTTDTAVLDQVLNSYDRETPHFYRWTVEYDRKTLSRLIEKRTGIDFGDIINLMPEARGTSGRLYRLRIVGTRRTKVIGKELAIRRALSETHLYSSAFVVERRDIDAEGIPGSFVLHGAGWGHGVGLCQIGAAVMGEKGYLYDSTLLHYYRGASITTLYQ